MGAWFSSKASGVGGGGEGGDWGGGRIGGQFVRRSYKSKKIDGSWKPKKKIQMKKKNEEKNTKIYI